MYTFGINIQKSLPIPLFLYLFINKNMEEYKKKILEYEVKMKALKT